MSILETAAGRYALQHIYRLDNQVSYGVEMLFRDVVPAGGWEEQDRRLLACLADNPPVSDRIFINLTTEGLLVLPEILVKSAARRSKLVLEWVEDHARALEVAEAGRRLRRWRERYGIELAVDDYGSGEDGFGRVVACLPNYVKVSGLLVHQARQDGLCKNGLCHVLEWCQREQMRVIFEWIETRVDWVTAWELGAFAGQGWWFDQMLQAGPARLAGAKG